MTTSALTILVYSSNFLLNPIRCSQQIWTTGCQVPIIGLGRRVCLHQLADAQQPHQPFSPFFRLDCRQRIENDLHMWHMFVSWFPIIPVDTIFVGTGFGQNTRRGGVIIVLFMSLLACSSSAYDASEWLHPQQLQFQPAPNKNQRYFPSSRSDYECSDAKAIIQDCGLCTTELFQKNASSDLLSHRHLQPQLSRILGYILNYHVQMPPVIAGLACLA